MDNSSPLGVADAARVFKDAGLKGAVSRCEDAESGLETVSKAEAGLTWELGRGGSGFTGGSFKEIFCRFCWNAMIRACMSLLKWPWAVDIGGEWLPSSDTGRGEPIPNRSKREVASEMSLS